MLRRIIEHYFNGVKLHQHVFRGKGSCLCPVYFSELFPGVTRKPLVPYLLHSLVDDCLHGIVVEALFYESRVHVPGLAEPGGACELCLHEL